MPETEPKFLTLMKVTESYRKFSFIRFLRSDTTKFFIMTLLCFLATACTFLTLIRSICVLNGKNSSKNISPSEKMSTLWEYAFPSICKKKHWHSKEDCTFHSSIILDWMVMSTNHTSYRASRVFLPSDTIVTWLLGKSWLYMWLI